MAVLALWGQSISLVLHQKALLALWVLSVALASSVRALLIIRHRGAGRLGSTTPSARRAAGLLLLSVAVGTWGGILTSEFLQDAFLPRIRVEGAVERLDVQRGPRSIAVHRYVWVGGRRYEATADVFTRLRHGTWIRAEVGAGSGRLLSITL